MVEWGRVLCREGFWVLRFDYRGYGDSDGLFEQFTIDDYLADIRTAMAELERRAGVPCRGLCGLRLGATLAALTAPSLAKPPMLILWEPVINGADYIDELLRLVMAKQMKESGGAPKTRDQLKQDILNGGEVDENTFRYPGPRPQTKEAAVLIEPYDGPKRLLDLFKEPAKKLLWGKEQTIHFEPSGNYIYRIHPRQIGKKLAAMGYAAVAYKTFNDIYLPRFGKYDKGLVGRIEHSETAHFLSVQRESRQKNRWV